MSLKNKTRKHLKMRNKKFVWIWSIVLAIVAIIAVVVNVMLIKNSAIINGSVGQGPRKVVNQDKIKNWNTNYYVKKANTPAAARKNAEKVAQKVGDEGEVLLKNDGALPLRSDATVTPYGYAYLNPAYSGTGAGASSAANNISPSAALKSYFKVDNRAVKKMKKAKVVNIIQAKGTTSVKGTGLLKSDNTIHTYAPSTFNGLAQNSKSTALVFITRQGNEGTDKKMDGYTDGTPHYLALSENEKATIKAAKQQNKKVVVVIVSSNPMELTPLMSGQYEADSILWIGNPGSQGFKSMAKILAGKVDPSGRLTDTYASDFTKDPTYKNMGEFHYNNVKSKNLSSMEGKPVMPAYYLEYQEGIFSGYRYYETAAKVDPAFKFGELNAQGGIKQAGAVAYPFGYGLSYTSFDQKITSFKRNGNNISVDVKTTNTGKRAGKDAVQLYYTSPVTALDTQLKIAKSAVTLGAFSKTDMLKPGESQTKKLNLKLDEMASYSEDHKNTNGTKGAYMLDAGKYTISLQSNSHDVLDQRNFTLANTIWYEKGNARPTDAEAQGKSTKTALAASNQFQDSTNYMEKYSTILTNSNWNKTFPEATANRQKSAPQFVINGIKSRTNVNIQTDKELGNVKGSKVYTNKQPKSGENNGMTLSDLRGKSYDDKDWDKLLDQIDYKKNKGQISNLIYTAGYSTGKLNSIGKPETAENDGDTGLKVRFGSVQTSSWMSKPVIGATWNKKLVREVGDAIGQEALTNGLNGWYAPGMNIHRSPFAGRALEYFSEDPVITGDLAAQEISGAGDQGLYTFMKHYALNDEETNREFYLNVWANEQTMREVYLKPYEIAVKQAKMHVRYSGKDGQLKTKTMPAATGIMVTQSCIGTTPGYNDYSLLTGVLRNEWNFRGAVITDLMMGNNNGMSDKMVRAGGDLYLIMSFMNHSIGTDYTSATARTAQRQAIHRIAYMVVNSALFNNVGPGAKLEYGLSNWKKILIAVDVVLVLILALAIWGMVHRTIRSKDHPELFKVKKNKKRRLA